MSSKTPPEAFVSANLWEAGMGYVLVTRFKSDDRVETGVFLLDVYCLGVKDAFFTQSYWHEYQERVVQRVFSKEPAQPLTPTCARKLVEQAVDYAKNLGFSPHADYRQACRVFGGILADECALEFTFGKEGKPWYVQGPNDSPARVEQIMNTLKRRCGEGNFHYIIAFPGQEGQDGLDEDDPAAN